MTQVSLDAAIKVAENYLNVVVRNPQDVPIGDRWIVSVDKIKDFGEYWLFHYQSELYVKTGNPSYLLAGNLPLKVSKSDGAVLGFAQRSEI